MCPPQPFPLLPFFLSFLLTSLEHVRGLCSFIGAYAKRGSLTYPMRSQSMRARLLLRARKKICAVQSGLIALANEERRATARPLSAANRPVFDASWMGDSQI